MVRGRLTFLSPISPNLYDKQHHIHQTTSPLLQLCNLKQEDDVRVIVHNNVSLRHHYHIQNLSPVEGIISSRLFFEDMNQILCVNKSLDDGKSKGFKPPLTVNFLDHHGGVKVMKEKKQVERMTLRSLSPVSTLRGIMNVVCLRSIII